MHGYNQEAISGTWFPTGFHGHFRSKSRQEFTVPYRQRAKPPPPSKFLDRASERSNHHLFSRHDNRNVHASTMGDLEMHFTHGLGKRKPSTGAAQHYKDTSGLLHWSTEPKFSPLSSYRADYLSHSMPQQRIINKTEPVHSRSHLALRRRQLRPRTGYPTERTAPLLAWNVSDTDTHSKPCVGVERNYGNRRLLREPSAAEHKTVKSMNANADMTHVIETVTRLDL